MIKKELFNNKLLFPDLKTKEDFVLWLKLLTEIKYLEFQNHFRNGVRLKCLSKSTIQN